MRLSKSKSLSVILILAVTILAISSSMGFVNAASKVKLITYKNVKEGFQVGYPSGWTKMENYKGLSVFFISPIESMKDTFQENVSIAIEDLKGQPVGLKTYYNLSINNLKSVMKNFKLEKKSKVKLGGKKGYKIIYTATMVSGKLTYTVKYIQIFTIKKGKAYAFTYSASPQSFNKFLPTANAVVKSFKFSK